MTAASRLAEGRYLMLLNNDCVLLKGALRALYTVFEAHENVGIAVPLFLQSDGDQILDAGGIIFSDSSGWQYGRGVPCLLYTSPSPRDGLLSRMPSSA